jgi:hypothetical protein
MNAVSGITTVQKCLEALDTNSPAFHRYHNDMMLDRALQSDMESMEYDFTKKTTQVEEVQEEEQEEAKTVEWSAGVPVEIEACRPDEVLFFAMKFPSGELFPIGESGQKACLAWEYAKGLADKAKGPIAICRKDENGKLHFLINRCPSGIAGKSKVKTTSGLSAEERAKVAAERKAAEEKLKAEREAARLAKLQQKHAEEQASIMAKAIKLARNAPDEGTKGALVFDLLHGEVGATLAETRAITGQTDGTWMPQMKKWLPMYRKDLYGTSRVCEIKKAQKEKGAMFCLSTAKTYRLVDTGTQLDPEVWQLLLTPETFMNDIVEEKD